jgi:hypothetical protein
MEAAVTNDQASLRREDTGGPSGLRVRVLAMWTFWSRASSVNSGLSLPLPSASLPIVRCSMHRKYYK